VTQERQKQIDKLLQIAKVPSEKQVKARQDLEYRLRLAQHMSTLASSATRHPRDNGLRTGAPREETRIVGRHLPLSDGEVEAFEEIGRCLDACAFR
jgi:hypothetical protein